MDKFDLADFPVIGLAGLRGAGKNYTADLLKAEIEGHSDKQVVILSFADTMRDICKLVFGWTSEQMADRQFKEAIDPEWGVSPRHALQTLGTQWGRDLINPEIWTTVTKRRIREHIERGFLAIVDDVRFDNEAQMLVSCFDATIIEVLPDAHSPEAMKKVPVTLLVDYLTCQSKHVSDNRLPEHLITETLTNDFTADYSTWVISYASDLITQHPRMDAA